MIDNINTIKMSEEYSTPRSTIVHTLITTLKDKKSWLNLRLFQHDRFDYPYSIHTRPFINSINYFYIYTCFQGCFNIPVAVVSDS